VFNGLNVDGTRHLYANDFLAGDIGPLSRLERDARHPRATVIPLPAAGMLPVSGLALLGLARRRRG